MSPPIGMARDFIFIQPHQGAEPQEKDVVQQTDLPL